MQPFVWTNADFEFVICGRANLQQRNAGVDQLRVLVDQLVAVLPPPFAFSPEMLNSEFKIQLNRVNDYMSTKTGQNPVQLNFVLAPSESEPL